MSISSKKEKNMKQVLDFVSNVTQASSAAPTSDLVDVLEAFGFVKSSTTGSPLDGLDDLETISDSSFSFNIEASSAYSGSSASLSAGLVTTRSQRQRVLAMFSSDLVHRSFVTIEDDDDNHEEEGDGDQDGRARMKKKALGANGKRRLHDEGSASLTYEEEVRNLVPWRGLACCVFIDLSGYSTITSVLTNQGGAHALSSAVNNYFEQILQMVVDQYHGDVLTFAGDAIVVCWPCFPNERNAKEACVSACACALDLQRKCGISPVPGTNLSFKLHIGVTAGEIESKILVCKTTPNSMQRMYHFVSGIPLMETASVVDSAQVGQVCITNDVRNAAKQYLICKEVRQEDIKKGGTFRGKIWLLTEIDEDYVEVLENQNAIFPAERTPWVETGLVPPSIAKKLRQGFKPSHVAEMRYLCVLFVKKKENESLSAEDWFGEVQRLLDLARCPVVQVLHDDKGTHLIAAVNLYRTERSPASAGVTAVRNLVMQETGSIVGIAIGKVFCGITGSDKAGRWDITGPAVVRACRLMQHAEKIGLDAVIDDSVYSDCDDMSQLEGLQERIYVKGSPQPIQVYRLADSSVSVTSALRNNLWASPFLHGDERSQLFAHISKPFTRSLALVSGPIGCGKQTLISAPLEGLGFTSMFHAVVRDPPPLGVVDTLSQWFSYHSDKELQELGKKTNSALHAGKQTKTLELAHQLVNMIIKKGVRVAVVVMYGQYLDTITLRFLKALVSLMPPPTAACEDFTEETSESNMKKMGKFLVIFTAYPVYGARTISSLAEELQRPLTENSRKIALYTSMCSHQADSDDDGKKKIAGEDVERYFGSFQEKLCHIKLSYPKNASEMAACFMGITFFQMRDSAASQIFEATGGCLSLAAPLGAYLREDYMNNLQKFTVAAGGKKLDDQELKANMKSHCLSIWATDGTIHLTPLGVDHLMRTINWLNVAPHECGRLAELYDSLPPRLQLLLRIVASISTTTGSANKFHAASIMKKINSKISEEMVFRDLDLLCQLEILAEAPGDYLEYKFSVPAMLDVVGALLTPEQDRMLKRFAFKRILEFVQEDDMEKQMEKHYHPVFFSFVARLANAANELETAKEMWQKSWQVCLEVTEPTRMKKEGKAQEEPEEIKRDEDGNIIDFLQIRKRMEERIAVDCRRYPQLCNEKLFKEISGTEPVPLMKQFRMPWEDDVENAQLMPEILIFSVTFFPPMGLAAISGEMQKIAWIILNEYLDITKEPDRIFIPPEMREGFMRVDVDELVNAIEKLESYIPKLTPEEHEKFLREENHFDEIDIASPTKGNEEDEMMKSSLNNHSSFETRILREPVHPCPVFDTYYPPTTLQKEERPLLQYLISVDCKTADEAEKKLRIFRAYYMKCMLPRRDRFVAFVKKMDWSEANALKQKMMRSENLSADLKKSMEQNDFDRDPVSKAFVKFVSPDSQELQFMLLDHRVSGDDEARRKLSQNYAHPSASAENKKQQPEAKVEEVQLQQLMGGGNDQGATSSPSMQYLMQHRQLFVDLAVELLRTQPESPRETLANVLLHHPSNKGKEVDGGREESRAVINVVPRSGGGEIPLRVVHEAILELAVGGWSTKYFHINVQLIRDFILRRKVATPADLKTFLLGLKLFGEELTSGSRDSYHSVLSGQSKK